MPCSFDGPITSLLPHRGPMLLIDRVIADDADHIRVEAIIKPDQLFLSPDGLPAWVGVELMAQTVASFAGLRAREKHDPVRLGFLLGTRRYECSRPFFPREARLEIEATQELNSANGLAVFFCTIFLGDETLATAQLNVFQPPDVEAYLRGSTNA